MNIHHLISECLIENCDSCYSNSFCKKCSPPYTLHHGRCVMKCPSGLYYDSQIHACSSKGNIREMKKKHNIFTIYFINDTFVHNIKLSNWSITKFFR